MSLKNALSQLALLPLKLILSVKNNPSHKLENPKSILIIWTNISFGILISSRGFFLTLRKKYPSASIQVIVNKETKQKFDQSKSVFNDFFDNLISSSDFGRLINILRERSEISIVPTLGDFNFTNYVLLRIANSKARIGVSQFNNKTNPYEFLFDRRIILDFIKFPDIHISQILLEQLQKFNEFDEPENVALDYNLLAEINAKDFKTNLGFEKGKKIIVINLFVEEIQNGISLFKYIELVKQLSALQSIQVCLIDDKAKSNFRIVERDIHESVLFFPKNDLKNLIGLLCFADLAITCDSEFMHVAGATDIHQISLFGLSDPFNLAPVGKKKKFIRKSELIEDIETSDILEECKKIISNW